MILTLPLHFCQFNPTMFPPCRHHSFSALARPQRTRHCLLCIYLHHVGRSPGSVPARFCGRNEALCGVLSEEVRLCACLCIIALCMYCDMMSKQCYVPSLSSGCCSLCLTWV